MWKKAHALTLALGLVSLAAIPASAQQGPSARDRAIERLTDSRDMSTGLAKGGPAFRAAGGDRYFSSVREDRDSYRLTDSPDFSVRPVAGGVSRDRFIARMKDPAIR